MGADLHFGHEYHDKIEKMALVGDHSWVKFLAKIADPSYAKEANFGST